MAVINPKHLILNLLMEADAPMSTQMFVQICAMFDITANSTRVSLARLSSDNMIQTSGRSLYRLGPGASRLAEDLAQWRTLEDKVCEWDGAWIAAFIGNLGRADRTALRRRTRILKLAGFEELETGLLVRPHNLVGGADQLRERLHYLGLEPQAMVFTLGDLEVAAQQRALQLWDTDELNRHYVEGAAEMERWMASADQLAPEVAARESFLIGDQTLRCIAYDPMLPKEMIDVTARRHYVETMVRYDQVGKAVWQQLYQTFRQAS